MDVGAANQHALVILRREEVGSVGPPGCWLLTQTPLGLEGDWFRSQQALFSWRSHFP